MAENQPKKKSVGRPKKYSGKRPTWTVRLEESVGNQVKEMASSTGRSISEMCEHLITQGLDASTRIKFLEMTRDFLQERVSAFEEEHLIALENAADQFEESSEPPSSLADLIENAVERGVKRALEQKD
jgi:hypothetical protein